MNARRLVVLTLLAVGCSYPPASSSEDAALPAGLDAATATQRDAAIAAGLDAAAPGPDAAEQGLDAAEVTPPDAARPSSRTLVDRPMLPTSPQNLLLDPFVTADRSWGHFIAFYLATQKGGSSINVALPRTYLSASPVGMSSPVVRLTNLGTDAGSTRFRVVAKTSGGDGTFQASIWVSAGDPGGAPVPYASAAANLTVWLFNADASLKVQLQADPTSKQTLDGREWVRLDSGGSVSLAHGQWFEIDLGALANSWLLAAPQVVPDQPAPPEFFRRSTAKFVPTDDDDRASVLAYGEFAEHH